MNISEIKQDVINAQIKNLGFYTTEEYKQTFNKLTTSEGIDLQLVNALSKHNNGKVPICYLTYDSILDTIHLRVVRFSYKNETWVYDQITYIEDDIKWIRAIDNEYVLTYAALPRVGQVYNTILPVIFRT